MSDIISTDIDETYPIAGQDNDSQGFRDNFSIIKNSLATARQEITFLEENTAKKGEDNDFNNSELQRATLIQVTEKAISQSLSESSTINWTYGSYQEIIVTQDLSITLASWADPDKLAKMRVVVKSDGLQDYNITFLTTLGNTIYKKSGFTNPIVVTANENPHIFDFWTSDGGDTVYGIYHGEFTV